ncbi:MAG: hypothetical protein HYS25_08495 [Ignavibacteriales bacterium]|nr:hypothetical protein [Ignavibacteriales bacterium]
MRITENMLTDKYLYNQSRINERKIKIQTQMANNSKLEKLTDDLFGSLEAIKLNSQIVKKENYQKNISSAKSFVNTTNYSLENVASQTQGIISQITNIDNALNANNFATVAETVRNYLQEIVQSLNEKQNDMYIFGGTNFTNKPWDIDASGKAVTNSTDMGGEIKVQLTPNIKDTINVTGTKIENADLLDTVNDIIDALDANTAPDQTLKDRLNSAYNEIIAIQSVNGEKLNKLEDINTLLENQLVDTRESLSKVEGVDQAELLVDLEYQDYLLQLSYKLASSILPKSILDYL